MDDANKKVLSVVGTRLRKARLENRLTQEALAGPEFTKGYVSALERGAVRPSLKALDIFARRLNMPISEFLAARLEEETPPERDSFQENLIYQFNYARTLIRIGSAAEALDYLSQVEAGAKSFMQKLPPMLAYHLPYLRGLAYIQQNEQSMAQVELENALAVVEREGDTTAAAEVRNALGHALYLMNQPVLALEHHLRCMEAVKANQIADPNLRISIYSNLADDYMALGDSTKAASTNRAALKSLEEDSDLQQQANAYWNIAAKHNAAHDWARAKLYATRALHLFDAADNRATAGAIAMKTAAALIAEKKYAEAEQQLSRANGLISSTGDRALQSRLYLQYAELALESGDLEQAAKHTEMSIVLSDRHRQSLTAKAGTQAHNNAEKAYVQALCAAALIQEKRGDHKNADRQFELAIDVIGRTSLSDMISQVDFAYAQVLEERGDHKGAMEYYRKAAQVGRQ